MEKTSTAFAFLLILVMLLSFSFPHKSLAIVNRSFGGRIVTGVTPGVTCWGEGLISITPFGAFSAHPYSIPLANPYLYRNTPAVSGGQILGLFNSILSPGDCYTDSTPPAPYPTFKVLMYGTSAK